MTFGFLRTRVGRRFLTVNLLSAFLPLAAITVIAYTFVRAELGAESRRRVRRLSKTITLSTLSTLDRVARDARGAAVERGGETPSLGGARRTPTPGNAMHASGELTRRRELSADELAHLSSGRPLLVLSPSAGGSTLLIGRALLPWSAPSGPVTWAAVSAGLLWGGVSEVVAGEDAAFCVFEAQSLERVHCAEELPPDAVSLARAWAERGGSEQEAGREGEYFVAARDVYLRHEFGSNEWRVVVLRSTEVSYASLASLDRTFVLLSLAVATLIFLVSHAQIRHTTEPLARLLEGTQRLRGGDFTTPVAVTSDDEYAQVAQSFNGMSRVLDRQMSLMRNLDALDQSALGARDARAVIDEALGCFCSALACARVTVAVTSPTTKGNLEATSIDPLAPVRRLADRPLPERERIELLANPRQLFIAGATAERSYLPAAPTLRAESGVLVLPLIHDHELLGLVAIGCTEVTHDASQDHAEARRLADRLAMALSNVQLVCRLDALSVGTLVAFARAIDANSPWTAGHSERVTRHAARIGRELRLSVTELETLECGGLLHDIGKIAVPAAILDKPGKLDPDEWEMMKRHPVAGFDILSPILAFADALPIVRSHHEKPDGSGYPDALRGEEIPFLARVLAVADVFDALVSERPYRKGLSVTEACDIIQAQSGSHFDPAVVRAFLNAVRHGRIIVDDVVSPSSFATVSAIQARGAIHQLA